MIHTQIAQSNILAALANPPVTKSFSKSMYHRFLGDDFYKLHPKVQERFGLCARDAAASVGEGVMDEIWHGSRWVKPFLALGGRRNILTPKCGKNIAFTVENYAYYDDLGRETITWVRTFQTDPVTRFDAYMIACPDRGCIVDYLGTHQHLSVDLHLSVSEVGGLRVRSGEMRFYEGIFGFPLPLAISGFAAVHEWYDPQMQCFRIEVEVRNPVVGKVAGYRGRFQATRISSARVPDKLLPQRYEARP